MPIAMLILRSPNNIHPRGTELCPAVFFEKNLHLTAISADILLILQKKRCII